MPQIPPNMAILAQAALQDPRLLAKAAAAKGAVPPPRGQSFQQQGAAPGGFGAALVGRTDRSPAAQFQAPILPTQATQNAAQPAQSAPAFSGQLPAGGPPRNFQNATSDAGIVAREDEGLSDEEIQKRVQNLLSGLAAVRAAEPDQGPRGIPSLPAAPRPAGLQVNNGLNNLLLASLIGQGQQQPALPSLGQLIGGL